MKLPRSADVLRAIRALAAGRTLIDQRLESRASSFLRARAQTLVPPLTDHELEILDHVLDGRMDREIAERMSLDPSVTQSVTQGEVAAVIDRMMISTRGTTGIGDVTPTDGKHGRTI